MRTRDQLIGAVTLALVAPGGPCVSLFRMNRLSGRWIRSALALVLLATPGSSFAQRPSVTPITSPVPAVEPVDPDSPRAAITQFLELTRSRQYDEAGSFLALTDTQRPRAAELARYLRAVLDRHLWVDLERLSSRSTGDERDGLPPGMDEIGRMPSQEPIRIVRLENAPDPRWVFSNGTVSRIDFWYAGLSDRWIRENAPEFLLRRGPRDMLWWQWIAVLLLGGLSVLGGRLLAIPVGRLLRRVFSKTKTEWGDVFLERATPPLTLLLGVAAAWFLLPFLDLFEPGRLFVASVLRAIALIALFWALWRSIDLGVAALQSASWSQAASAKSLVSLASGLAKVGVAAFGLIAALSELGYPVSGLLAGLGIGGLALALAAQKTGENLFGSLSLALDRPFDVGEFVKIEDFVGHVEKVGLRSTRFRTLDRTLITIPNGRVADMRIENYTSRDRLRLACTISLLHGTRAAQVKEVLSGVEALLRAQPKIWPEAVTVRLREFGAASLDIEVGAWFLTADWSEFLGIRQDVLLQIMEVVESAGTSLAFPTRTLLPALDAAPASPHKGAATE